MTIRSALVALGTSIVVLAAALLLLDRYDHEVWLVLAVGIGVVAFSSFLSTGRCPCERVQRRRSSWAWLSDSWRCGRHN